MWQALARVLQVGGQLALGYFANDVANAAGQVTGVKTNTNTGKYPWWFIVAVLGAAGAVLYFLVNSILPAKARRK